MIAVSTLARTVGIGGMIMLLAGLVLGMVLLRSWGPR